MNSWEESASADGVRAPVTTRRTAAVSATTVPRKRCLRMECLRPGVAAARVPRRRAAGALSTMVNQDLGHSTLLSRLVTLRVHDCNGAPCAPMSTVGFAAVALRSLSATNGLQIDLPPGGLLRN